MATLMIQCKVVWYEKLEFFMRSAACLLLYVCLLLAILRDIVSLIHCKVVRYEKLEFLMRSAVCLLLAILRDTASLIQYKVVRYES